MSSPLNEKIADRLTGGQFTEARAKLDVLGRQYTELYSDTKKIQRQFEELRANNPMIAESYADASWNNRINLDKQWLLVGGWGRNRAIEHSDVILYHDLLSYAYHYSPLIKGAIDLKTRYTFGQGYSITSESLQESIDAIMKDPRNRLASFSDDALGAADRELQKSGNLFIAVWVGTDPVQIRFWTDYEITEIVTNPDDADIPMYYIRSWTADDGSQHQTAYPSVINGDIKNAVRTLSGSTVTVDPKIVIYHMTEGKSLRQKWALSPYTSCLPWNRAYEKFLYDFGAIVETIRKYATMFTTTGGNAQVNALASQFSSLPSSAETCAANPPPQAGAGIVATEGNDFKVVDAGSNKIVGPADSQYFLRQFCTSSGIPENMLTGNPQTGNRASAQELTANFLPLIEARQTAWAEAFRIIFSFVLGSDDFEVSFPPLRSQDAMTYVDELIKAATLGSPGNVSGIIQPADLIKAIYEALDIKVPDNATIDDMAAAISDRMMAQPATATALQNLTQATTQFGELIRASGAHIAAPKAAI